MGKLGDVKYCFVIPMPMWNLFFITFLPLVFIKQCIDQLQVKMLCEIESMLYLVDCKKLESGEHSTAFLRCGRFKKA